MEQETFINILLFVLSFIFASLVFLVPFIKSKKKFSEFLGERKDLLVVSLFLFIGSITRVCLLDIYPGGLNQDEASAGYDAYSIMKYGIDRNGMRYPIHLVAWGSGQNALYSYIVIPFIALLGNTTIALRLPMAIVGCISLHLLYFVTDRIYSHKFSMIALLLLCILPWHVMKSRWH